jgi:hypothetical protein
VLVTGVVAAMVVFTAATGNAVVLVEFGTGDIPPVDLWYCVESDTLEQERDGLRGVPVVHNLVPVLHRVSEDRVISL